MPLERVLKLLDCPVCWKGSEPSALIQCRNGHFGCKACFSKLKTCPLCRITLDPQIQTFHQENIDLIQKELRHVENHGAKFCLDGIAKIFKCTDCKFTPTNGPIFQCLTGHVICYRCTKSMTWCTPCQRMSNYKLGEASFVIRSQVVQELLSFASKPCRFTEHGCTARIEGFSQHEVNCQYSENCCILAHCLVKVSLPKLLPHILESCRYKKFVLKANDPSFLDGASCGKITIYDNPVEKMWKTTHDCYGTMKLGANKYFVFCFRPVPCYKIFFYTYFLGVPEEAKKYHYVLKMVFTVDGPLVERRAPVISASIGKYDLYGHPDVITFTWTEFRELLNMNTPDFHFKYVAQVFENETQLSEAIK